MTIKERLEKHSIPEPNTGCWLWTGRIVDRYGRITINHKNKLAHRVSYSTYTGKIKKGMHVLHSCDTPSCINPNHLFLGTHKKNMADRDSKNRQAKGERNGRAILKPNDVLAIHRSKGKQKEIAKKFGIKQDHVSKIKRNITWKHLTNIPL